MRTQHAKALIGLTVLATGAALTWRGVTVWSSHGVSAVRSTRAITDASSLPSDKGRGLADLKGFEFDIDPAAMSIDEATAALERALKDRALAPPPGEPADVWRPRMLELAERVPQRMRAIWSVDEDALASLSRESGATSEYDIAKAPPELRSFFTSLGEMWKTQWANKPASSAVRMRTGTYGEGFLNPFAPPSVGVRNPFRLRAPEEPEPDTLMHEALIPVRVDVESPAGAVDAVLLGIMYYWSEEESRWRLYRTSVYHRHAGGQVIVGSPP